MIIKSIHIGDFSGAKSRDVSFAPGFNVVEGPNESGKTTIASFIKFIFYGFADKAERTRYFSWGSQSASGSMVITADGRDYRIERECDGPGKDKVQIVDTMSGALCFEGRSPADVFLGVPYEIFAHTAFIGQTTGGEVDGEKVSRAIENILFSGDEMTSTAKAEKKLDEARTLLYHKNRKGGRIYDLLQKRDDLTRRLENAKQANVRVIECESGVRETKQLLEANRANLTAASEGLERVKAAARSRGLARLRELSEASDRARREYDELCRTDEFNGFLPDAAYVSDLDRARRECDRLGSAIEDARTDYESYSLHAGDFSQVSAFSEKVGSMGGPDRVMGSIGRYHRRQRRAVGFTAFFFFLAALLIAAAAVAYFVRLPAPFDFFFGDLKYTAIFGGAAAVALASAITCIIIRSHSRIEINEIICELDADGEEELERRLATLNYDETRLGIHKARTEEYETRMAQLKKQKGAADALAAELLRRWGKDDMNEAAEAASASVGRRAELMTELEKYDLARDTLAGQLDITDISEALAAAGDTAGEDELTPEREERLHREFEFYSDQNKALTEKLYAYEKDLAVLEATVEPADELADRVYAETETIDRLSKKHSALVMAHDALGEAANDLRESVSPRLAETAGELMASLTEGRYDSIGVGRSLELMYETDHRTHGIEYMSAGTGDIAYLSLRFALIDLLYDGTIPPLVFDESFSRLDDRRYRRVLALISEMSERGVQTLLFTSQTRDSALARECVPGCNGVSLSAE